MGFSYLTGELYNNVNVNIDYIGPYCTVESSLFTLAIDDSTGIIEQWKFLEMTDSWEIPIEGKSIEKVIPSYHCSESDFQAIVTTIDELGVINMYFLYPNEKVKKLY